MNTDMKVTLRVAPGNGIIARVESAVIYIPDDDHDTPALVTVFSHAADSPGLALGRFLVDNEFSAAPFVLVEWAPEVLLMAFGDIEITTDQPSLPMLSGAGSSTWVEHRLRGLTEPAAIMVDAPERSTTDLRSGVVHAGGFLLELAGRLPELSASTPPTVSSTFDSVERVEPLALEPDPAPPEIEPAEDPDRTVNADEILEVGHAAMPLVDAKVCPSGHPNPPTATMCRICGTFLAAGDADLQTVQRPSLGTLKFDDGSVFSLDAGCVLGRKPTQASDSRSVPITVTGDKVSRQHVEVILRDWEVMVADLGSRNGTIVVPNPSSQPIEVEPGTPQVLEPGSIVYVGSRSFVFDSATGSDTAPQSSLPDPGRTPPPPQPSAGPMSPPDPKSILDAALGAASPPHLGQ